MKAHMMMSRLRCGDELRRLISISRQRRRTSMTVAIADSRPGTLHAGSSAAERLSGDELRKIHAYWRACNFLGAGMIYLQSNPLLREPLKAEHIKRRLLGHWGTSPGLSFIYVHLNRLINKYGLDMI